MDETKNQISDLEHKETKQNKKNKSEQEVKRTPQNEDSINTLWENFRRSNIHIIGMPEEEKKQGIGNLSEKIVKENFLNLVKKIDMQA